MDLHLDVTSCKSSSVKLDLATSGKCHPLCHKATPTNFAGIFIQYSLKEQGKSFACGTCNKTHFTILLQINRALCHGASMPSDNCKKITSVLNTWNANRLSGRKGTAGRTSYTFFTQNIETHASSKWSF